MKRLTMRTGLTLALLIAGSANAQAGWLDWLLGGSGNDTPTAAEGQTATPAAAPTPRSTPAITDTQVTDALRQALEKGTQVAVQKLGQPGGFLDNAAVKIPMPPALNWVEKTLRQTGQGQLADQFVQSMNQAAEQAVPVTAEVFTQAIRNMSLDDARKLLAGGDHAATDYLRTSSSDTLRQRIRPLVSAATAKVGVTGYYKQLMAKADFLQGLVPAKQLDLDGYVTDKTLDGLFTMIAAEEQRIRANPVARTTDLLKQVFGNLGK